MITEHSPEEVFEANLKQNFEQRKSSSLEKMRVKGWEQFSTLGLPTRRSEVYQYVNLRKLFSQPFTEAPKSLLADIQDQILPECKQSVIVLVNGVYRPDLSNRESISSKVGIYDLEEAAKNFSVLVNNRWLQAIKDEKDPFAALNASLHHKGVFIYIPPKMALEAPVQILNIIDVQNHDALLNPRIHVFAGTLSQATLVNTTHTKSGSRYFVNQVADIVVEEGAQILYDQMTGELPEGAWMFDALRASLKRDSILKTISITRGCAGLRQDYHVQLTGENSECFLNGLWMLKDKREAHTHVLMDHQAPNCRSLQLFKGVVDEMAHSSFEGKIYVRQAAQKTQAFQLNNNMLLSDSARADSKPNLEIFADDVKASHGATVGQPDAEQLFYLRSRGFGETEAKKLLVTGYSKEIMDMVTIPSVRESVYQYL